LQGGRRVTYTEIQAGWTDLILVPGERMVDLRVVMVAVITASLVLGSSRAGRADELLLANGGRISGTWLNRERRAADPFVLLTQEGVRLTLDRDQVREAHRSRVEVVQYQKLAPTYPDTAAAQWQLAEWCRKHNLLKERQVHLAAVLKRDPNHHEARYASGYRFIRGQWLTVEEFRRSKGYERYEGEWRLAQEIQLEEARRKKNREEREWSIKLHRWRENLETKDAAAAAKQIVAVRDQFAVPTLKEMLLNDASRAAKLLYVEALVEMNTTRSIGALVVSTLSDPDEEVFYEVVRRLVETEHPELAEVYATTLTDPNNVRVNRAAIVLAKLEATMAIDPLIEALSTTHAVTVGGNPNLSADAYSASFGKPGNGALPGGFEGNSFTAGNGAKTTRVTVNNQQVLNALVGITGGVNFGFDQKAWRHWQSAQKRKLPVFNVRRD